MLIFNRVQLALTMLDSALLSDDPEPAQRRVRHDAVRPRALGVEHRDPLRHSSQAKGRVARANLALQDRLVKELRLAGISDVEAGNTFLPGFIERFNQRFSVRPAKTEDQHRRLNATMPPPA